MNLSSLPSLRAASLSHVVPDSDAPVTTRRSGGGWRIAPHPLLERLTVRLLGGLGVGARETRRTHLRFRDLLERRYGEASADLALRHAGVGVSPHKPLTGRQARAAFAFAQRSRLDRLAYNAELAESILASKPPAGERLSPSARAYARLDLEARLQVEDSGTHLPLDLSRARELAALSVEQALRLGEAGAARAHDARRELLDTTDRLASSVGRCDFSELVAQLMDVDAAVSKLRLAEKSVQADASFVRDDKEAALRQSAFDGALASFLARVRNAGGVGEGAFGPTLHEGVLRPSAVWGKAMDALRRARALQGAGRGVGADFERYGALLARVESALALTTPAPDALSAVSMRNMRKTWKLRGEQQGQDVMRQVLLASSVVGGDSVGSGRLAARRLEFVLDESLRALARGSPLPSALRVPSERGASDITRQARLLQEGVEGHITSSPEHGRLQAAAGELAGFEEESERLRKAGLDDGAEARDARSQAIAARGTMRRQVRALSGEASSLARVLGKLETLEEALSVRNVPRTALGAHRNALEASALRRLIASVRETYSPEFVHALPAGLSVEAGEEGVAFATGGALDPERLTATLESTLLPPTGSVAERAKGRDGAALPACRLFMVDVARADIRLEEGGEERPLMERAAKEASTPEAAEEAALALRRFAGDDAAAFMLSQLVTQNTGNTMVDIMLRREKIFSTLLTGAAPLLALNKLHERSVLRRDPHGDFTVAYDARLAVHHMMDEGIVRDDLKDGSVLEISLRMRVVRDGTGWRLGVEGTPRARGRIAF